jgi:solute carrier family 25 carnitine/acylcarnitine transporter 20/29
MNGLVFSAYRGLMRLQLDHDEDVPTLTQVTLAGIGTGFIGSWVPTVHFLFLS